MSRMAKRMATTTVNRCRRRSLSVSFSMSGSMGRSLSFRSVDRLAAGRLEKHLLEALHTPLCMEDGHVRRGQRGDERRRVLFLDRDPDAIAVRGWRQAALAQHLGGARGVVDAQLHL